MSDLSHDAQLWLKTADCDGRVFENRTRSHIVRECQLAKVIRQNHYYRGCWWVIKS